MNFPIEIHVRHNCKELTTVIRQIVIDHKRNLKQNNRFAKLIIYDTYAPCINIGDF
jgi:hypothetical protein